MAPQPLPRFLETFETRREHARKLEQAVRDAGADIRAIANAHTAADEISLRGIPAIGHGVAGVICGTKPGT